MSNRVDNDWFVGGTLAAVRFAPPAECIGNAAFTSDPAQRLDADKVVAGHAINRQLFADGTTIAAVTENLTIVLGAVAQLDAVAAAVTGTAAAGDRTVTIDVQKSHAGGAFASVLTTPLVLDSGNAVKVYEAATIVTPAALIGDLWRLVLTVGGSSGTQPAGLLFSMRWREDPA